MNACLRRRIPKFSRPPAHSGSAVMHLSVELDQAVEEKLRTNEEKYPIDESKGNATKYSRRR